MRLGHILGILFFAVIAVGCGKPADDSQVGVMRTESFSGVGYADSQQQEALKSALAKAGIKYRVYIKAGIETIEWSESDSGQVKHIQKELFGEQPPPCRSASYEPGSQYLVQARELLREEKIPFEEAEYEGWVYMASGVWWACRRAQQ